MLFANGNSRLDVQQLCADSGNTQAVVYVSEESQYSSLNNYIGINFISTVCPDPGLRLVQESPKSGCFQANRTDCNFNCTSFFDAETCQAQVTDSPTSHPTQLPSAKPLLPPTVQPTLDINSSTPVTAAPSNIKMAPSAAPSSTNITTSAPTIRKPETRPPQTSPPETTSPAPSGFYTNRPTVKPTKSICDCSKSAKGKGKGKGNKGGGSKKSKGGSKSSKGSTYVDDDFFNDYNDDFYDNSYCDCGSFGKGKGKGGKSSYHGTRGADWRAYHSAQVNHQFQHLDLNNLYNC